MFFVVLLVPMHGTNSNNFSLQYEEMLWTGLQSFSHIKEKSFVQNRLYEYGVSEIFCTVCWKLESLKCKTVEVALVSSVRCLWV